MSLAQPLQPTQERAVATRLKLLDAAVDELVENGYARLTTSAVAHRAKVSRGAQQRYFPHKELLVEEAVGHLVERQNAELHARIEVMPSGPARVRAALDLVFELYAGQLFAAVLELAFAARTEPSLASIVNAKEQEIGHTLQQAAAELLGHDLAKRPQFAQRWATALAAARGLALLRVLGHPEKAVQAQWAFSRARLIEIISA